MYIISPHYTTESFDTPWTIDTKIEIFRDRTLGWQLDIADQMLNGLQSPLQPKGIPNAGFAAMQILFSYFEMIAKYADGYTGEYESKHYFQKGVAAVWPEVFPLPTTKAVICRLYKHGRNGLYHNSATGSRIILTGELPGPIAWTEEEVVINPHFFVKALKRHFHSYIAKLKMPEETLLRENFKCRFDTDVRD